jgi:hypothetical protein
LTAASASRTLSLTKSIETMTAQELREFRTKYAAIVTASPALIDQVIESEERAEPELPLGDSGDAGGGDAGGADVGADAGNSGNGSAGNDVNDCGPLRPGMRFRFNAAGKLEEDGNA